jgi:hypothetical protein
MCCYSCCGPAIVSVMPTCHEALPCCILAMGGGGCPIADSAAQNSGHPSASIHAANFIHWCFLAYKCQSCKHLHTKFLAFASHLYEQDKFATGSLRPRNPQMRHLKLGPWLDVTPPEVSRSLTSCGRHVSFADMSRTFL